MRVKGQLTLPEKYKGKIDLSRLHVTLQHFPSHKISNSTVSKDGSFSLNSELNGMVRVNVYQNDRESNNLLRAKTEIRLTESMKTLTLKPLELQVIPQLTTGSQAPDFNTKDIYGKSVKLSDYNGKVVLLNVYSTVYPGSIAQRPHIDAMSKKYKNTDKFVVIGLSRDQNEDRVLKYFKKEKLDWVSIFDGPDLNKGLSKEFGVIAYPQLFIIGPDGKILDRDIRGKSIETAVDKAMQNLIATK